MKTTLPARRAGAAMAIPLRSILSLTLFTLIFFAFSVASVHAQISITSLNTTYSQNFDGMGTFDLTLTDDITGSLPGFHGLREFGNTNPNFVLADSGLETSGGFRNYGPPLQLDRALGMLPDPTTGFIRFGVRFVNNSGRPVNTIQVTYTGEQWRNGGNLTPQTLTFSYRKDANVNDLSTGTYTVVPALSFTSPAFGPGSTDLDGNAVSNKTFRSAILAVNVLPGEEIMLRWESLEAPGEDHGLAVDDLFVTPRGGGVTAAGATISGRVMDAFGRGVGRTRVELSGGLLAEPVYAFANQFGYYRFDNISTREAYTLRVESKRYSFMNPVLFVNIDDNMTGVDFIANP